MARKPSVGFDARAFLPKARTGRSVAPYRKKQVIFAQGDPADAVSYLEKGQITSSAVELSLETHRSTNYGTSRPNIAPFLRAGCRFSSVATASSLTARSLH
jgi:hypothetical protein